MHPEEEKNTHPSDGSPTQDIHPLSSHAIWIEGIRERAAGYLLKVHDLTTGEDITNVAWIDLKLHPRHLSTVTLTLYSDETVTETVTVRDPTVSLTAYVHDVYEEKEG